MTNGRIRLSWPETAINLAFKIAKYRSEDPWVYYSLTMPKYDAKLTQEMAHKFGISLVKLCPASKKS